MLIFDGIYNLKHYDYGKEKRTEEGYKLPVRGIVR